MKANRSQIPDKIAWRPAAAWGGSVRLKRPMRPLCGSVRLKRPLCGSMRLKRLKGPMMNAGERLLGCGPSFSAPS
jgi:hypothetical protein